MSTLAKLVCVVICCILCVRGHPSIQLTVTSHSKSVNKRPEVPLKQNNMYHLSLAEGKVDITDEVIEKMLPYEAEEAIVTRERMDVSKWGKDLPKIKPKSEIESRRHKKVRAQTKRKRKGKRKNTNKLSVKIKNGLRKHGYRLRDLKKKKKKIRKKTVSIHN